MATSIKHMQKSHDSKVKQAAKPPKGMMDVCKGHDMAEEKSEQKGAKK